MLFLRRWFGWRPDKPKPSENVLAEFVTAPLEDVSDTSIDTKDVLEGLDKSQIPPTPSLPKSTIQALSTPLSVLKGPERTAKASTLRKEPKRDPKKRRVWTKHKMVINPSDSDREDVYVLPKVILEPDPAPVQSPSPKRKEPGPLLFESAKVEIVPSGSSVFKDTEKLLLEELSREEAEPTKTVPVPEEKLFVDEDALSVESDRKRLNFTFDIKVPPSRKRNRKRREGKERKRRREERKMQGRDDSEYLEVADSSESFEEPLVTNKQEVRSSQTLSSQNSAPRTTIRMIPLKRS